MFTGRFYRENRLLEGCRTEKTRVEQGDNPELTAEAAATPTLEKQKGRSWDYHSAPWRKETLELGIRTLIRTLSLRPGYLQGADEAGAVDKPRPTRLETAPNWERGLLPPPIF